MKPFSVLFVCMANICRSPTADGVFGHKVVQHGLQDLITVDSAGTHNFRPGSPPDHRTQEHAARRGYDLSNLRARQIKDADFEKFDLILAMDWDNLALIQDICPAKHQKKVRRMSEFCLTLESPVVPDPYQDGPQAFELVLDLIEDASEGLIRHIRRVQT
jgi:protein-tyrosine phosphatase